MNESGRGLPLPAFKKKLVAVTEAAQPDDFFLEHSRERELAYTLENARRWHEVVAIASRHPGAGPTKSCLDVGTSPLTFVLKDYFQRVATLDYTAAFAPRCRRHGIDFFQGGILAEPDLLPETAFDCILFLEVLEHLHLDPTQVLAWLQRKLRPGGLLILSTPNMMCLGNRINMLFNRRLKQFSYPPFSANEFPAHGHKHDRIYMPAEMRDYLRQGGWRRFRLGYHGVRAADDRDTGARLTRFLRLPVLLLKWLLPSLRDRLLILAWEGREARHSESMEPGITVMQA